MDSSWSRFPMGRKLVRPFWFSGILLMASLSYAGEARQAQSDDWEKILARARQDEHPAERGDRGEASSCLDP